MFLFIFYIYSAVQREPISPSNWSRFYKSNWFGVAKAGWGMLNSFVIVSFSFEMKIPCWFFFTLNWQYVRWMAMEFFLLATSHHLRLKLQETIHGMSSKLWRVLLIISLNLTTLLESMFFLPVFSCIGMLA